MPLSVNVASPVVLQNLRLVTVQPRIGIAGQAPLRLKEVIERVLANDPDLAISRIQLQEAGYQITSAKGYYDPIMGLRAYRTHTVSPVASILGGAASGKLGATDLNVTPQLSGITAAGGTYSLNFANARQTTDNTFNTLNPQYPTALSLNLVQPLWRGLRFDENRHRLQVARKNQQLSTEQLRQRVIEVVTQAVQAYWELDYAYNNFNVQSEAVRLAERQYESNRRQAEQGILAPVDVVAAQTQAATFQQSLFTAQQVLTSAENSLKSLMLPNRSDLMWEAALIPETPLDTCPHRAVARCRQPGARRPPRDRRDHPRPRRQSARRATRHEATRPHINVFANLPPPASPDRRTGEPVLWRDSSPTP